MHYSSGPFPYSELVYCVSNFRLLRLEFNQNHCDYYTEIDAVYLHGLDSKEEYNTVDKRDPVDNLSKMFGKQTTVKNSPNRIKNVDQASWNIMMLPVCGY